MSQSLIRKNQLHPDISDLVGQYGSGYFVSPSTIQSYVSGVVYTTGDQVISGIKTFRENINVSGSGNFGSELYIKNSPIYSYGTFYDTGNYAISSTTSSYLMQFGSTGIANGITIGSTGSTDRSKIIIRDSGIYNLQFSSQVSNSENNVTNEITIWLKKNGVDEPWTTSIVSIPGLHSSITGRSIPSWNFFVNANTGDYFQLAYQGNSTNLSFNSVTGLTSPTRPNIPANILTVNKVGY